MRGVEACTDHPTMASARSGSCRPSSASRVAKSSPPRSAWRCRAAPSLSPASKMGTTFGWSSEAASSDSRKKPLPGSARRRPAPGASSFSATRRFSAQLLGQVDDAHAAAAQQGLDAVAGQLGAAVEFEVVSFPRSSQRGYDDVTIGARSSAFPGRRRRALVAHLAPSGRLGVGGAQERRRRPTKKAATASRRRRRRPPTATPMPASPKSKPSSALVSGSSRRCFRARRSREDQRGSSSLSGRATVRRRSGRESREPPAPR